MTGELVPTTGEDVDNNLEKAYFAGGCFWCMEPPFEALEGVKGAVSGYMGGTVENPTYEEVTTGETGHAEVFWRNIDPTALNYQFADVGSQYRTEIFTVGNNQKNLALASKQELENSDKFDKPIVTAISEAPEFYIAEEYHQDFYKKQSMRYQMYANASGRKGYLEDTWGNS